MKILQSQVLITLVDSTVGFLKDFATRPDLVSPDDPASEEDIPRPAVTLPSMETNADA